MRKTAVLLIALCVLGCAKVSLQTAKPLKVDINMRVDVYQHVAKDVASIEDQVYGSTEKRLNALFGATAAYAQEPSGLDEAITRRKERSGTIEGYFVKGYIGENRDALLVMREAPSDAVLRDRIASDIQAENEDRNAIYNRTAEKNNADLASVRKIFLDDHYRRAAAGEWFEIWNEAAASYQWVQK